MPMKNIDPSKFAQKWNRRLKAAIPDIREGVQNVTESPMEKAANAKEKMKAHLIEAIDSGKWETRLRAVSLDQWKRAILEKGIPAISTGADMAVPKVEDFANQLLPYEKQVLQKIEKMPTLTLDDSIRKMETWVREMSKFRYKPTK